MRYEPALAGTRILVVDDELDTLELECLVLESQGAEVLCADDAARALAELPNFRPDLIISDLAMPGMDGCAFIAAVRRQPIGDGRAIPALAVSAHASGGNRAQALAAGFDRFLAKPVDPDKLIATMRDLLVQRRPDSP